MKGVCSECRKVRTIITTVQQSDGTVLATVCKLCWLLKDYSSFLWPQTKKVLFGDE